MAIADALLVWEPASAASAVRPAVGNADSQRCYSGNSREDGREGRHRARVGAKQPHHRRTADVDECARGSCDNPPGRRADGRVGLEQPHDQHRACHSAGTRTCAALGSARCSRALRRPGRSWCWQTARASCESLRGGGAGSVGQQSVVPEAVEAARQHVQQEAAHELVRRERHGLVAGAALGSVVPIHQDLFPSSYLSGDGIEAAVGGGTNLVLTA